MKEIKLLKHNQDMVTEIEQAMIFGNHKIFYTEATGLGKSFIFMYLVNKYFKDKKVLYICPKMHIWYNLQTYEEFELIKDCITMTCNADFNKVKDHHLGYDVIFIDEAHHLTAPIQGENIMKVADTTLKDNPNAYVFGFTATPYVDNIFIGDEYFQKSIIGMDLCGAIDSGILQKINFAIAVNEDIVLSDDEKDAAIKFNIDTTSNTTRGIIDQYSSVKHWLVYFPFIDELEANIPYFEKHFPEFKLFVIHSEVDDCDSILDEFDKYDGKAFLVSVSMVLEGIHPRSVEGILLYRNVTSDITFMQVIGRLGTINLNKNPIFVDIYKSYDNFLNSGIVKDCVGTEKQRVQYDTRDYIIMRSNTYKFIELSKVIYRIRQGYCEQEYRGYRWINDADLSRQLGKSQTYVRWHINRGETHEQIIDNILDPKVNNYRGITWVDNADLCRQLGKCQSYVHKHLKQGESYEEIIDGVLDASEPEIHEYRGITWTSDLDLSRKLGKYTTYVYDNLRQGKSYEEIIDGVLDAVHEYRGITWTSDMDLCRKLNKSENYVSNCRRQGKSYEEIIDGALDASEPEIHEYRGITWITTKDLSVKLGIDPQFIYNRLYQGKTYEEIIDCALDASEPEIHEYRGITWTSDLDLSRKLGKYAGYVSNRRRQGESYEEIIDDTLDASEPEIHEYRGITWTSDRSLSRKLGKSESFVKYHLRKGESYEEIIDGALDNSESEIHEYRGITWTSDMGLSIKLGKHKRYVYKHLKQGKTHEQIIDEILDSENTND